MPDKKRFSQSAVENVSVEGDFTIEKINQIINLSDDEKYKYEENIRSEYRGKLNESKIIYKDATRSLVKHLRQELRKLRRDTENSAVEEKEEVKRLEIEFQFRNKIRQRYAEEKRKLSEQGSDEEPSISGLINEREWAAFGLEAGVIAALASSPTMGLIEGAYGLIENPIKSKKEYIQALEEDLEELKEIIESVSRFTKVDPANLDIDRIIQVENFEGINEEIKQLKSKYKDECEKIAEEHVLKEEALLKERDFKLYKLKLVRCLDEDGFPLSRESLSKLSSFVVDSTLSSDEVEEADSQTVKFFCQKNLDEYENIYSDKLSKHGFPLPREASNELGQLKEKLGLNSLSFLKAEVNEIEREQIRPYYEDNLESYLEKYKQALEKKYLAFDEETSSELRSLEYSLGLKKVESQESKLDSEKYILVRNTYEKSLGIYRKMYFDSFNSQGINLTAEALLDLTNLKESLGLTRHHIKLHGYEYKIHPEKAIKEIKDSLIEQFYKSKLLEFSLLHTHDLSIEEDYVKKGIRKEDLRVVKGIIDKGWSIDSLVSEKGSIDYWKLISFLNEEKWQQANEFTLAIFYELTGQTEDTKISKKNLEEVSEKDVYTLDKIWCEYSNYHFGFSIQKSIFEALERNKNKLFDQIGWRKKRSLNPLSNSLKSESELTFSLEAPVGHLPAWNLRDKQVFENSLPHLKTWGLETVGAGPNFLSDLEDMQKYYSERDFWKKIQRFGKKAGAEVVEKVLTLYYAAQQDIPLAAKATMLGAIGYFILPFDFISDFIPIVGWSDDVTALGAAVTSAASYITPEVTQKVKDKIQELFPK